MPKLISIKGNSELHPKGNAMKKIPKKTSAPEYKPKHIINYVAGAVSGVACGLLINATIDLGVLNIIGISLAIAIIGVFASYYFERDLYIQSEFMKSLEQYVLGDLIKLSNSPELDDDERRLIVKFLNENHSGWSLV